MIIQKKVIKSKRLKELQRTAKIDSILLKSLGGNTVPVRFRPWAPLTY